MAVKWTLLTRPLQRDSLAVSSENQPQLQPEPGVTRLAGPYRLLDPWAGKGLRGSLQRVNLEFLQRTCT